MMLPLEEHFNTQNEFRSKRNNVACGGYGKPQVKTASPREVTFSWNQVESAFGGVHDIAVSATIRLTDEAAFFSMEIDNQSDLVVENLYYPCFAAVTPPDWDKNFEFFTRSYINPVRMPIYPNFQNTRGYFGVDHPIMYSGSNPQVPYVLLRNEEQGMCAMIGERTMDPLFFIMELFPGWDESMTSHWSHQETVSGKEVYAAFYAGQLPFIRPGEKRAAISVMLEPYTGGWDSGADVYVKYKKQYFKTCDTPDWLKHPHSWLQYQMNSPEDELRLRFRDLPALAADCLKAGITTIQLVGWNDGGQDQGNPSHNFDPRLGTKEEFYQAIKTCQEMGVKIILFSKFTGWTRAQNGMRKN